MHCTDTVYALQAGTAFTSKLIQEEPPLWTRTSFGIWRQQNSVHFLTNPAINVTIASPHQLLWQWCELIDNSRSHGNQAAWKQTCSFSSHLDSTGEKNLHELDTHSPNSHFTAPSCLLRKRNRVLPASIWRLIISELRKPKIRVPF